MSKLDDAMQKLAAEWAAEEAPAEVERAVMAAFDRTRRARRGKYWAASLGAIAASLAVIWLAQNRPAEKLPAAPPSVAANSAGVPVVLPAQTALPADASSDAAAKSAAPRGAAPERPFVPIPYVLPPAPYERVEIVRMRVPVAALIAAGLPMETSDAGAQAEADVLVGQDGRPRAVRLVSISFFN